MRGVPASVRNDRAQLIAAFVAAAAIAATPSQASMPRAPAVPLRATYTVETNKLGQVVRVRGANASRDAHFNAITRSNALQAFIRRPNGTAVAGVYTLTYDYSPKTKMVRRDVRLVHAGGVDPNAPGAVTVQLEKGRKPQSQDQANIEQLERASASDAKSMPDFEKIVSPAPSK